MRDTIQTFSSSFSGEFDHAINLSRPKLIFASKYVAKRAIKISEKNPFVKKVILIDSDTFQNMKKPSKKLTTTLSDVVSSIDVSYQSNEMNRLLMMDFFVFHSTKDK